MRFLKSESQDKHASVRFEQLMLPHLDAAYNLAHWLARNDQDAQDVVQEAYLRAWRFFPKFRGGDACAWLLKVVRNTCYTWLEKNRPGSTVAFDDEVDSRVSDAPGPDEAIVREDESQILRRAIEQLPMELREVLVLRELQGLSYKEIAALLAMPLGTVMSRLSRARDLLQQALERTAGKESELEL
jgi:RNA polymerase sigma-70 factor (ECF subfamily)